MRLKIHCLFILYILILFFCSLLQYYLIFFVAILIHETTHAIVGKICGLKVKNIEVNFSGLSLQFENFEETVIKKIIILLSGPIVNLIIAIFAYIIFEEQVMFFVLCNFILFIFNMLPIYPLDGGKILLEILKNRNNYERIMETIQKMFCVILVLICIYMYINFQTLQMLVVGFYLLGFGSLRKYDKYFLKYD